MVLGGQRALAVAAERLLHVPHALAGAGDEGFLVLPVLRELPHRRLVVDAEVAGRSRRRVGRSPEEPQRVDPHAEGRVERLAIDTFHPGFHEIVRLGAAARPRQDRQLRKCRRAVCTISSTFSGSSIATTSTFACAAPAACSRSSREPSP